MRLDTTFKGMSYYLKKLSSTNDNKKFFIPHYYCFGEREVKDCKKFKIKVLKIP